MIIFPIILLLIVILFVIHAILYNHSSYRILYRNKKYVVQKSYTESSWGDSWTVWKDVESFETKRESIDYVKNNLQIKRKEAEKEKTKTIRYFF